MVGAIGMWERFGRAIAIVTLAALAPDRAGSQSLYYHLDTGRPTRVDDATPTDRYAFELLLAPLRGEWYPDGVRRYRVDPKLSFGMLPRTELEVRVPIVSVHQGDGVASITGVAGVGVGATHAFTLEGQYLPAIAFGGEWLAPTGRLAAPSSSYAFKGMFTKTFSQVRVHFNIGGGTYSLQPTSNAPNCVPPPPTRVLVSSPDITYCSDSTQRRIVTDVPCGADPSAEEGGPTTVIPDTIRTRSFGVRQFVGIGIDHAFARQSTLVMADLTSERFVGLYPTPDLVLEVGIRHQLSPLLTLDAGVGRKVYGSAQYTSVTVGATYEGSLGGVRFCAP